METNATDFWGKCPMLGAELCTLESNMRASNQVTFNFSRGFKLAQAAHRGNTAPANYFVHLTEVHVSIFLHCKSQKTRKAPSYEGMNQTPVRFDSSIL